MINELKYYAQSLTILIAEDDKELNKELVELCSLFFKKVLSSSDGLEALEKYNSNKIDIVLSDITMPNVNGVKLSSEIKNINREQTIIILTAHTELDYIIELIDIGISQFVSKPFEDKELIYRLLKVSENIVHKKHFEESKSNFLNNVPLNENIEKKDELIINEEFEEFTDLDEFEEFDSFEDFDSFDDNMTSKEERKSLNQFNTSHSTISASAFLEEYDNLEYILEDVDEIDEYLEQIIYSLEVDNIQNNKHKVEHVLNKYASFLNSFSTFGDLSSSITLLKNQTLDINFDSLDEKRKYVIVEIIKSILSDLDSWKDYVFIEQTANDVYYINASIYSNCLQLQNLIK